MLFYFWLSGLLRVPREPDSTRFTQADAGADADAGAGSAGRKTERHSYRSLRAVDSTSMLSHPGMSAK